MELRQLCGAGILPCSELRSGSPRVLGSETARGFHRRSERAKLETKLEPGRPEECSLRAPLFAFGPELEHPHS
jgi:hypothetical protein